MHVGESKYPHPLITLVAVLVAALALSAIIWAETGWPWRSDAFEIGEGTEEAETSSYIEYNGERVSLARSEYGGEAAHNLFTFAITPNFLVFPEGERYRYEIKPGKVIAWNGLPLEALTRLNPDGSRASLYVDEYTPIVLLNHLLPQFLKSGYSGVDFILKGPEGEIVWQAYSSMLKTSDYCIYWDRRVLQLGTPNELIKNISTEEYLFLTKDEFALVTGEATEDCILLPGPNTTFSELVAARDALWEVGLYNPALFIDLYDQVIELFKGTLSINPGYWEYNIQPAGNFPPETPPSN